MTPSNGLHRTPRLRIVNLEVIAAKWLSACWLNNHCQSKSFIWQGEENETQSWNKFVQDSWNGMLSMNRLWSQTCIGIQMTLSNPLNSTSSSDNNRCKWQPNSWCREYLLREAGIMLSILHFSSFLHLLKGNNASFLAVAKMTWYNVYKTASTKNLAKKVL